MKRVAAVVFAVVMAVSLGAAPALAHHEGHGPKQGHHQNRRKLEFTGVVTAASADSLTFTMLRGNKAARRYVEANPGDVTVSLNGTRFSPKSVTSGTDLLAGERVTVLARKLDDGSLAALLVHVRHSEPEPDPSASASPSVAPSASASPSASPSPSPTA